MDRSEFVAGVRDALPAVPPNVPLGMLFGATAVQIGMDPLAATAFSLFGFTAIAQLTAVDLVQSGAALPVVVATVLLINARYVIYSASLAPQVRHLSSGWRAAIAYPLFDINFALASAQYADAEPEARHRGWYFLGASFPLVLAFVLSTVAGAVAGSVAGRGLHLDFAIPLVFIAVLTPQIDDEAAVVTAVGGAVVSVAGAGLPFNLGLLLATFAGTAVGAVVDATRWEWFR